MSYFFLLNSINALLIIGVSLPTLYMASKIKKRPLKALTLLISSFLFFHGVYHLSAALSTLQGLGQLGLWSDAVFEPLSWFLFLLFAVYFARRVG